MELTVLHRLFCSKKTYGERLSFYHTHFNLLPDIFPRFDHHLSFLHTEQQVNQLKDIYRLQTNQSVLLKRSFIVENKSLVFDITPQNSQPPVFNEFIIERFIDGDTCFSDVMNALTLLGSVEGNPVDVLLKESDEKLLFIRQFILGRKKVNFNVQLMTVFWSGYNDYLTGTKRMFRYRKKMIELYMYAQGNLYCRYREALVAKKLEHTNPDNFIGLTPSTATDWPEQVLFLKKIGVLDFLKSKRGGSAKAVTGKKLQQMICRIIGLDQGLADSVGKYLNVIEGSSVLYYLFLNISPLG